MSKCLKTAFLPFLSAKIYFLLIQSLPKLYLTFYLSADNNSFPSTCPKKHWTHETREISLATALFAYAHTENVVHTVLSAHAHRRLSYAHAEFSTRSLAPDLGERGTPHANIAQWQSN